MKIAFHGQRGSYTEAAAAWMFSSIDIATVPVADASTLLNSVREGQVQLGVLRFEMSQLGTSFDLLNLVRGSGLAFQREIRFHERYNLASRPGVKRRDIRRVLAAPMILHLCSGWLSRLKGVDVIARFNAGDAIRHVAQEGSFDEAAVCGDFAAGIYGLEILEAGIENNEAGETRFVAIGPSGAVAPGPEREVRTSLLFELRHEPGALMAALAAFKEFGINLELITGRPTPGGGPEHTIYVEFAGGQSDHKNRAAMEALRPMCAQMQVLGSYATAAAPGSIAS